MAKRTLLILFVPYEHQGNWAFVTSFHQAMALSAFRLVYVVNEKLSTEKSLSLGGAQIETIGFGQAGGEEALVALARREGVSLALSLGDWGAICVAQLNQALNLPGYRPAQLRALVHKDHVLDFARMHGIRMPQSAVICTEAEFQNAAEHFHGPVIIKPTHSTGMEKNADFDYEIFPSMAELHEELVERGQLERFFGDNREPSFLGAHLVQQYIPHDRLLMVNFAIVQNHVHILQLGRHFYRDRYVSKPFAVGAPEPITTAMRAEIFSVVEKIRDGLEVRNSFGSIQFVIDDEQKPYAIDFHFRLGQAKGVFIHYYKPEILHQTIAGMLGDEHKIEPDENYCLKYSFFLRPGKFDQLIFPEFDQDRLKLCNMSFLEKRGEVPVDANYYDLGSYFTLRAARPAADCAQGKEQIWREANEFVRAIEVR